MTIAPTIIIDTREQTPLQFQNLESEPGTLQSGDYSIKGMEHLIGIERKSTADLISSVTSGRERFERELHRLHGFRFKRLLIEGTIEDVRQHRYRSKANPKSVLNSLHAFEVRYDVPVVWGGSRKECALLVEQWAVWFAREQLKAVEHILKEGETNF